MLNLAVLLKYGERESEENPLRKAGDKPKEIETLN
jgi:hypothetical protein